MIGFVGRLQPEKGVDVLLIALSQVLAIRPDVKLDVVGTGPQRHALQCVAEDLGIASAVRFRGFCDDVHTL